MGVNVWASRVGNFVASGHSEWAHVIHFNALSDLATSLTDKKLKQGEIEKLVIIAHGDAGGVVQLDRVLTPDTISSFASEIDALRGFMGVHCKLIFMSCISAVGPQGSLLLTKLSSSLTNRHIIGFTIKGAMMAGGWPSTPGQVYEGDNFMSGMPAKAMKGMKPLTEYSVFSKWGRNGFITKIPYEEQVKNPNFKCAWWNCPGHAKPTEWCQPHFKGVKHLYPYPG
jgi:Domain of unknown function (DUF4347)